MKRRQSAAWLTCWHKTHRARRERSHAQLRGEELELSWAVETTALTKRFPNAAGWRNLFSRGEPARPALDGVELVVGEGELFGLLGPNGAGKTTLVKILSTLIQPTSGNARVNGYDLSQDIAIKATIGLVTSDERSFYWRLSGQQNLEFFARLQGIPGGQVKERVAAVMEQVGIEDVAEQRFMVYSTGMRQRLSIARALLKEPRLLFLDEPTKGLDPLATRRLRQLIRDELVERHGITVLLTTHDLEEAEILCDRIAILHQGRLRAVGTMDELRRSLNISGRVVIQVASLPNPARELIGERLPQAQIRQQTELSTARNHTLTSPSIWIELPNAAESRKERSEGAEQKPEENLVDSALDLLRSQGISILEVSHSRASLEEIFTHTTESPHEPEAGFAWGASRAAKQSRENTAPEEPHRPATPKATPFLQIIPAFLRRDLLQEASYRLSFFLQFINIFFSVLIFYFISRLLGEAATPYLKDYGGDYFAFVLIGIAFLGYFSTGLSSFANNLRHAQTTGTLEAMLTTPTRLSTIILASSLWDYLVTTLRVLVYLILGVFFMQRGFSGANYLATVIIILLTVITASSLGIISASVIMVVKRGDPIQWAVSTLTIFLGGVYYPTSVLPPVFDQLSRLIPMTYSLHAMRLALLQSASLKTLLPDILALTAFSLALMPLGLAVFRFAVRRAKIEGSLTHY